MTYRISRRQMFPIAAGGLAVLGGLRLAKTARAAPAGTERLAFSVLREESTIGHHALTFWRKGEEQIVEIDIELQVSFGFITLFRYEHRNTERWRNGQLMSLNTQTNDDGTRYWVEAERAGDTLEVRTEGGVLSAPPDIVPTSYWNPRTVDQRTLLDTQAGRLLNVDISPLRRDPVATPKGQVDAQLYRMAGDLNLDLWYGPKGEWIKLAFLARGSQIEYRPETILAAEQG